MKELIGKVTQGDCLELMKDIPDKSIDLVLTDPPYKIGAKGRGLAGDRQYLKDITENQLDGGFDMNIINEFVRVCKTPNLIIFCSKLQLFEYIGFAKTYELKWQMICWHKTNPTPLTNNNYLPDTEYIFHIWRDRKLSGRYETKAKYYIQPVEKNNFNHPTVKPINIVSNLIENGSDEQNIILDPFLGSGTTAIASERLGRCWIGFEINQKYCEIAQERIDKERNQIKLAF